MKQKLLLFLVVIVLIFGAVLLGVKNQGLFTLADAKDVRLGAALALSGDASSWGESELKAIKLAISDFELEHNIKVDLIVEDTSTNTEKSVLAVQKLINYDKVDAIVGTTWLDVFQGAAEVANDNNIVLISPSGFMPAVKQDENYEFVYSTWYRNDLEMKEIVKYLVQNDYKKVVLFYEENPFWQALVQDFVDFAKQNDILVLEVFGFVPNTTDFRTQIAEAKELNSDAIFFGFDKEQSTLSFAKQIKEINPNIKVFSNETPGTLAMNKEFTYLFDSFYFIFPADSNVEFKEKYLEKYGVELGVSASNAYDSTRIILESVLKSKLTGESILELLNKSEFDTVTFGKTKFDNTGWIYGEDFVIKQVIGNKLVVVK